MLCFALQICNIKIDFTSVISPFFSVIKIATMIKKAKPKSRLYFSGKF